MIFPEQKWFVPGIIPEGLTILAGAPKVKKSFFALNVAIAVATGGRVLGSIPVEQHSVLFISLEDGARRLQKRQALMGCPQGTKNLYYAFDWQEGCAELRNFLSEHPEVKFVITDTLYLFSGTNRKTFIKDMNAYSETSEATKALKKIAQEFGIGIMAITHTTKSSSALETPTMNDIIGSQGTAGGADTILVMKKGKTANTADLYINGKDLEEDGIKTLQWDNDICAWTLLGNKDEVVIGETQKKIKEALEVEGALTSAKLYKILRSDYGYDSGDSAMRNILTRMERDGKIYHKENLYSVSPFPAEVEKVKEEPKQQNMNFGVATVATVANSAEKTDKIATPATVGKNATILPEQIVEEFYEALKKVPMSLQEMVSFCNSRMNDFTNVSYMTQLVEEGIETGNIQLVDGTKYKFTPHRKE